MLKVLKGLNKRMNNVSHNKVVISGAGPVGLLCAIELAHYGIYAKIIDPNINYYTNQNLRTIAISYGSMQILQQLGIDFSTVQLSPIEHVHISRHNFFGSSNMYANEYNVSALGYVVLYTDLCKILYQHIVNKFNHISFINAALESYDNSYKKPHENKIKYTLSSKAEKLYADFYTNINETEILIIAEGSKKNLTDNLNDNEYKIYKQNKLQFAHVGWLEAHPIAKYKHTTFERFTDNGPVAILPYKHQKYNYAITWCNFDPDTQQCNIDNLKQILGDKFLAINSIQINHSFKLQPYKRLFTHSNGVAYIGNAAQFLHPVAAQGLNLGFRQAHILAKTIATQKHLSEFSATISKDAKIMLCTTNLMANIFTTKFKPLNLLLGLSLNAIDIIPSVKEKFAQHFMYGFRQ